MLTKQMRQDYLKQRSGLYAMDAKTCLAIARHNAKARRFFSRVEEERGSDGWPVFTWKERGFQIRATVKPDDYGAGEIWCGKVDWRTTEPEQLDRDSVNLPGYRGRGFAVLTFSADCTYAARRDWYKAQGKALADARARDSMERDADTVTEMLNGDRVQYVVSVTVSRHGVELGWNSLGGVDVDSALDPYIAECIGDCATEAIQEARASIRRLCRKA